MAPRGVGIFSINSVRLWIDKDTLATRLCNSMSWTYSVGSQGQLILTPSLITAGACDGDGGQTMRFEARVWRQVNLLNRFELAEHANHLPTLTRHFTDGSRWELQGVQPLSAR